MFSHRLHAVFTVVLALGGPTQMGHQDHFGACCNSLLDGGQCRFDTGIAGDLAILNRYIEVFANQ